MSTEKKAPITVEVAIKITNNKTNETTEQNVTANSAFIVIPAAESIMACCVGGDTPARLLATVQAADHLKEQLLESEPMLAMLYSRSKMIGITELKEVNGSLDDAPEGLVSDKLTWDQFCKATEAVMENAK